jgi:signal transduction histidine kinase
MVERDKTEMPPYGTAVGLLAGGAIRYCNEAFRRFTGLGATGGTLEELLDWVGPEDRAALLTHLEAYRGGESGMVRLDLSGGLPGQRRPFRACTQTLESGEGAALLLIFAESSAGERSERDVLLDEARLRHEGRLAALGTMAAGIAHELNQPLNTIRVVTEGLLFGREAGWPLDADELFDNLEMISRQVARMDKVIQNVRNFARENRDQVQGSVNVNEAVENVLSMVGRQIEARGIRVEKDLEPDLALLKTTLNELEQVVMNLILNARQALDECDQAVKVIRIRTQNRGGKVILSIEDNGLGIPDHLLTRIFDPFFTTKGPGSGTGLGLSISQSIVSRFGGHIEACNNPSGGATFTMTATAHGGPA